MRTLSFSRVLGLGALVCASSAHANETTTFTYDQLGRLVNAAHSGTINNGLAQSYAHDPAGNRTNAGVSGSPYSSSLRAIPIFLGAQVYLVPQQGSQF